MPKYHADLYKASLLKKTKSNLAFAPPVDAPPQYTTEDFEDNDMLDALISVVFYLPFTFILQSFKF